MSYFKAKMHHIRFWLCRAPPQTPSGFLLTALPLGPELNLRGPTSQREEMGKGGQREGKGRGGEG